MSLARLGAFRRGRPDFLISRYGLPFLVTSTVWPGLSLSGSNCRAYWRAVTFFILIISLPSPLASSRWNFTQSHSVYQARAPLTLTIVQSAPLSLLMNRRKFLGYAA